MAVDYYHQKLNQIGPIIMNNHEGIKNIFGEDALLMPIVFESLPKPVAQIQEQLPNILRNYIGHRNELPAIMFKTEYRHIVIKDDNNATMLDVHSFILSPDFLRNANIQKNQYEHLQKFVLDALSDITHVVRNRNNVIVLDLPDYVSFAQLDEIISKCVQTTTYVVKRTLDLPATVALKFSRDPTEKEWANIAFNLALARQSLSIKNEYHDLLRNDALVACINIRKLIRYITRNKIDISDLRVVPGDTKTDIYWPKHIKLLSYHRKVLHKSLVMSLIQA